MAVAAISLNGRTYSFSCQDDEQARLQELANVVRAKLDGLLAEYGKAGDDRLLLLSALMIADEMLEARARVAALESLLTSVQERQETTD